MGLNIIVKLGSEIGRKNCVKGINRVGKKIKQEGKWVMNWNVEDTTNAIAEGAGGSWIGWEQSAQNIC